MKRVLALVATAGLGCALVGVATPAGAATSSAYSAAGFATKGSISPTASVGGSLGGLLGPILNPVLSGLVNPLLSGVASLPQNLVSGLTSSIVGATGTYASTAVSAPSQSGFPSCKSAPWTTAGSCYTGTNLALALPPLATVGISAASGYTSTVSDLSAKPIVGAASTALANLSLLGIPIISGGVMTAQSSCPTTGSTSASGTSTLTGLSLLNGLVTADLASSSGLLSVSVGGAPLVGVKSLSVAGLPVSVALNGNLIKLTVTLNVGALLSGLGLSVASGLLGDITSTSLALTVTIGPGSSTATSTSASAWGLEVGVDLAGSVGINVLGLATVGLTIPTGLTSSGGGNLLDLKLGYTTCTAAASTTTTAVPPGVN